MRGSFLPTFALPDHLQQVSHGAYGIADGTKSNGKISALFSRTKTCIKYRVYLLEILGNLAISLEPF